MKLRKLAAASLAAGIAFAAETIPASNQLVAHEWGTFTSVADLEGNPVPWLALGGPSVLPCFVHGRQQEAQLKFITYATVRMETPVIYFYTPRRTSISVGVTFQNGLITEWYPQAVHVAGGRIEWNVNATPGEPEEFPKGTQPNEYYEARATESVPLQAGTEREKLIFYRGVGDFSIPVRPRYTGEGRIRISSAGKWTVPAAFVFENRGGRTGFRALGALEGTVEVDPPELTGDASGVRQQLEQALAASGLYAKEAAAMLATWRESWFEEGARVFYVTPRELADAALPIAIEPAPTAIERVFVGRVELLAPATQAEIAAGDPRALARYGRFLPVFWEEMQRKGIVAKSAALPLAVSGSRPCAK